MKTDFILANADKILEEHNKFVSRLNTEERTHYLISLYNYIHRKSLTGNEIDIKEGCICCVDFGNAYIKEIGYQHLAMVIQVVADKAFVVPIISKKTKYKSNTQIILKKKKMKFLKNDSLLLLNDTKWINTSRIINIIGFINPESEFFHNIRSKIIQMI